METITYYESTGKDRISLSAWRIMIGELWESRELVHRLVVRNIAGQFRQSFLGYIWILLPPLATAVVFTLLQQARVVSVEMAPGGMPYFLFVMLGSTVWGYFSQFTSMATNSISSAGQLVSKVYFPREVLVISGAGIAVINLLIRVLVLAGVMLAMGFSPPAASLMGILLLLPLSMLALGVGLFLAPINAMANDVGRVLEFALQFGMFLAPVVFPTPDPSHLAGISDQILFWAHNLNPVSHYLYAMHALIEQGHCTAGPGLVASLVISVVLMLMGWRFFHICEPMMAERLG